jgi:hypothetical protein
VVKIWESFTTLMVWAVVLSLVMAAVLYGLPEQVNAADFHVTTAAEFETALDAAENNGQDDTIYLAAGTYWGNFEYAPQDGSSLVIRGELGTSAEDVILDGGGAGTVLWLEGSSAGGSVSIEGVTIQNGSESGLRVYCSNGSLDVSLNQAVIQNNSNEYRGGGIYLTPFGNGAINLEIWDSVIRYNQSPGYAEGGQGRGGGICATSRYGNNSIDLLIVNSLVYENQANCTGGGIEVNAWEVGDNNVTRVVVINSTITGNVSNMHDISDIQGEGGGIRVYAYGGNGTIASLDLYNTIVWGNTALGGKAGQDLYVAESEPGNATVNAYHSDIGDVDCSVTATYNPVNIISADPAFADPASDDYHLTGGSPCIDAGTTAVPDPPGLPATDIEGNPRVFGAAPDIGAYEWAGGAPPPPVIGFSPPSFSFSATEGGANPADQTLEVWNSGGGTLDWSVADGAAWLGLDPPNGDSTGEHDGVTVSVDISGMTTGGYTATITISAPGATNTPQTVPVNLTINPAGAGVTWNFPSTSDVFLCPTSANSRPYLDAAVSLPTGTEPAELLGVYWLDEATGGWQYFIPAFGGGTLIALEPGEAYLVAVSGGCNWQLS